MDVFDLRETLIPFSLLQVTNAFKALGPGAVMEIVAADTGIAADLQRILPAGQYQIVFNGPVDGHEPGICLRLQKTSHQ